MFLLGLLLRLGVLFLDFAFDVNNHISWAQDAITRGIRGFYETPSKDVFATIYPNYPPFSIFLFSLFYPIQSIIQSILWWINVTIPAFPSKLVFFVENRAFLAGMLKLPAVFADLGLAYMVYLFAKKLIPKDSKFQRIAPLLILFNPAFFFNSAYWGQIDVIPIFLVLGSLYLLLFLKKPFVSALLFTAALLVKPTALVYLPVYAVFFIWKFGIKTSFESFVLANFLFWLAFLPFYKNGDLLLFPYQTYYYKILLTQSLPFVTNGAFNFWVLITHFEGIKDTAPFLFGIPYKLWGIVITGIFYVGSIRFFLKSKDKTQALFYALFICAFASFLFLTKMHERYSMLPLPFLLLASLKDRKLVRWFIALSLLSFLNLYHSWPVPRVEIVATTLSSTWINTVLAALNIGVFAYLARRVFSSKSRTFYS